MESLDGLLQLNPQVTLRPVADYPLSVQERLNGALDDVIVSERRSRFSAIRVSASAAEMLRLFDAPRLVGEAMVELADRLSAEPRELLVEAFPVLVEMRQAGVLIAEAEHRGETSAPRPPRLSPGESVGGYKVVRALDTTTETEIYELSGPGGARAALKLVPLSAPDFVQRAAERECLVLPYLEARGLAQTPRLLGEMRDHDAHYIFLSWHDGRSLNLAARDPVLGLRARLTLARAIVAAYARLHAAGVQHGDVHGGNILVDSHGAICVIDYGAAAIGPMALPELLRIGLVESYEPEAAAELLVGRDLPPTTEAGEQFALASLLTLTIAGRPPLMLPLEHRAALEDIVQKPPRAWDMPGSDRLGGLEAIVSRALAKSPAGRFASIADFACAVTAEIDRVLPAIVDPPQGAALGRQRAPQQALHAQWGLGGDLIERGLPHAPSASIYYGAAGVALGLLRASVLAQDGELLAAAQVWSRQALAASDTAEAFDGPDLGVARMRIGSLSVLNNDIGLQYVAALVAKAGGDRSELARALGVFSGRLESQLETAAAEPAFGLDMAAGLPGLLTASLTLAELPDTAAEQREMLRAQAAGLRERLLARVSSACAASRFDGAYLGLAHGLAGAIHALIDADGRLGLATDARLEAAIDALAGQAVHGPDGVGWPIRLDETPTLGWSGWCHGSAGHIQLWLAAGRVCQPARCEELAQGAAEFAWKQRHESGCSLCCGSAGLALSYEKLAGSTGDVRWRRRAEALVFGERQDTRDLCAPASLFRGHLGVELARLELATGGSGAFPLLDSPLT